MIIIIMLLRTNPSSLLPVVAISNHGPYRLSVELRMSAVGFEPTIPGLEQAKTFHCSARDRPCFLLHRQNPSDRRLSAKLVPTFPVRGCPVVGVTDLYDRILDFLDRTRYFSSKQLLNCTQQAEWSPFQIHYSSENLVAPGIEPGPLDL
jgi:hypothetical protein